jgi:hypothetical protein
MTQKFALHAGGGAENGWEKRNVLIVSVLLPIAIDLALRSNMQRRVDVLRVRQVAILQGVAATPITFMRDAEVEDQAPEIRECTPPPPLSRVEHAQIALSGV